MKVTLPDEAVTYHVANELAGELRLKGQVEEEGVLSRRLGGEEEVLGNEHKDTLDSLNKIGIVLGDSKDYTGALGYHQQALRGLEKVFGKTHPDTLMTIKGMAITLEVGLKDFTKTEEMYRLALDGYEKSLGKDHEDTKRCARNLAYVHCLG